MARDQKVTVKPQVQVHAQRELYQFLGWRLSPESGTHANYRTLVAACALKFSAPDTPEASVSWSTPQAMHGDDSLGR